MGFLHIDTGPRQGEFVPLDRDATVLGRNHDAHLVIPDESVSRPHARVLRAGGNYFLEDLDSRNGTAHNGRRLEPRVRTPLRPGDRIDICGFRATFVRDDEGPLSASSVVEATLGPGTDLRLEAQPAERLSALLAITAQLRQTLRLDAVLPGIAVGLLRLFPQADRCLLVLADDPAGPLSLKFARARGPAGAGEGLFSHSLVRQCLASGEALLLEDALAAPGPPTNSVAAAGMRSVMCVPLATAAGAPLGALQVDTRDRARKFTEDDLRLLWGVAHQVSAALENARLHEERVAQERVRRDLELARQVQRSFLPAGPPALPGYEFFTHYEAAGTVGGDYYDFVPLAGGRLAVAVGDVAGKGVPAALLMAKLSADVRACLLAEPAPDAALARLNGLLYPQASATDRFVTLVLLVIDPGTHTVTLVNAGHPPPLWHRRASGELVGAVPVEAGGLPLGLAAGSGYEPSRLALAAGDSLLLFTDGVPDARDSSGREWKLAGVHAALAGVAGGGAEALGRRVIEGVERHAAGVPQYDDLTLVCFGRP